MDNVSTDDESVSSKASMDFHFSFKNIHKHHHSPQTCANSSHVELGPTVHGPDLGLENFSQLGDLSLSLDMGSRTNISRPPPLFLDHNWEAMRTLDPEPLDAGRQPSPDGHPQYHSPMPSRLQFPHDHDQEEHEGGSSNEEQETFKSSSEEQVPDELSFNHIIRKRARDDALKHCIKDEIGNGRITLKNQSTHDHPPLIALKNSLDGRVTNSVYDVSFEAAGLPIDPHLRLFIPL